MKKTLLLFAMLLGVVGAWAQIVFPEEGKFYVIKNFRSSKYATFMYGDNEQLRQKANRTANAIWYVTDVATLNGGGISCKLHNAATESIYAANNSFTATGVTVYIKENPHKTGYVCVSTTEDLSSNCWDDADRNLEIGSIGNYNPRSNDYDGTSWTFVDVTDQVETATAQYSFTDPLGQVISGSYKRFTLDEDYTVPTNILIMGVTLSNAVFENNTLSADIVYPFRVSNAEVTNKLIINGYEANSLNFKIYAKDNANIKVHKNVDPTADNINNYLWAIYPNYAEGTYAIKNIATGKFIHSILTTGNGRHDGTALSFNETATPFKLIRDSWGYSFKVATETLYLSINSSQSNTTPSEQFVGLHGNTHAGSSLSFIPYVVNYTITDEANNTYTGEGEGWAGLQIEPVFTGAAGYNLTNKVWDGNTFTATITFPFPVSKEVVISSFKGTKDPGLRKYYVGTGDNDGNVMYGPSNPPKDNKDKWIIEPSCNNTAFTFKIKNVGTSKYITTSATTTTDAKDSVTVTDAGTAFTVDADNRFKLPTTKSDGSALYLSAGSSAYNDLYLGAWTWNGNNGVHNGNCNYIYEVELPYEITDIAGNIFEGTLDASGASGDYPWISGAQLSNISFDGMKLNATVTFNIPVSDTEVTNPTLIINGASWDNTNSRKWRAVEDDGKFYVKVQRAEINYTDNNALWAIYPELNGNTFKFKIKSLSTGKFVKANPDCPGELKTDVTGNTKPVTLENEGTAFEYKVRTGNNCHFTYKNTSGTEVKLSMNSKNDDFDVFLGVYQGDHSGNDVAFPSYVENMNWPEFVSTGTTLNPLVIAIGNDVKKTLVAKKLPSSADRYVHVTASNEEPELGYGQWTIYPAFSGNKIGFKIKNIATDTYIYAKPNGASEEYPVVLNAEGTAFDFADSKFAYTDGANTLYLSVPTNKYNLPLGVGTEADETLKTITFPEFSSYQITIGTTGYTTVYSPFTAFTYSVKLKIYTITSAPQDGRVNLNLITSPKADDVSNYIFENQGVIIKGNSGTYTFYMTDDQGYFDADAWEGNKLSGSFTNTYVQGDAYVLSAPEGVESVGLYKALLNKDANGEAGTSHFKNNAGKAYLPASALSAEAAESRFFLFDFGGNETGIESVEGENGNVKTEVYDLAGRRVQNAKKGIFVINGKVVVK